MIELTNCTRNCNCQKDKQCQVEPCDKQRLDLNELTNLVKEWAWNKALINKNNAPMQAMKVAEEWGETCRAFLKKDEDGLIDGIGDTLVTLIIFAEQNGLDITHCLNQAWNEIKNRKGKTIDGTFIKES